MSRGGTAPTIFVAERATESSLFMRTQTLRPEIWATFFYEFNRGHMGWPVTIETMRGEASPKLADELAFQGISFDTKGSAANTLLISVGDSPQAHLEHAVYLPLHIRQIEGHQGSVHLLIEPAKGEPTVVHLHPPSHQSGPAVRL
jgi:hypothetical protein